MADVAPVNLTQLLDTGAWGGFQKRVLVLAALTFAVDGLANQALGLSIPALLKDWGIGRAQFAPIAAAGLVGMALGAAIGGVVGDRVGRRNGLIGSVLLFGVLTAAASLIKTPGELGWLRLVGGLGIGGAIPNGAALISEFTPLHRRSFGIGVGMVFIAGGALIAGLIGASILPALGWRGMFLAAGLLSLLVALVLLILLPESPRYLLRRVERHPELMRLTHRMGYAFAPGTSFAPEARAANETSLGALFGHGMWRDTTALWVAFFACLMANYTMVSWVPTLLAHQGFPLVDTSLATTAVNIGAVIGGVLSGWLIDRLGSRIAVLGLAAGGVIAAIVLGITPFSPATGLAAPLTALAFEGFFVSGLQNGVYSLSASIYPPYVRATGVGAAASVGRLGAVASSYTGVLALELGGVSGYFVVIALALGVSFLAIAAMARHLASTSAAASAA